MRRDGKVGVLDAASIEGRLFTFLYVVARESAIARFANGDDLPRGRWSLARRGGFVSLGARFRAVNAQPPLPSEGAAATAASMRGRLRAK
jgi:hypothetical protein